MLGPLEHTDKDVYEVSHQSAACVLLDQELHPQGADKMMCAVNTEFRCDLAMVQIYTHLHTFAHTHTHIHTHSLVAQVVCFVR